ncbi:hypothetical protein, partial [Lactiplantibacillus plantarum]|uniref:hypothetical protein n=1 Tax=Lactiplantibacillus plantarum TaxID=1590 RepID=UPI001C9E4921
SDTYILNLMGAFEFNHFAIRPQSGWFFVSHALAHSTGPKGINKKHQLDSGKNLTGVLSGPIFFQIDCPCIYLAFKSC